MPEGQPSAPGAVGLWEGISIASETAIIIGYETVCTHIVSTIQINAYKIDQTSCLATGKIDSKL